MDDYDLHLEEAELNRSRVVGAAIDWFALIAGIAVLVWMVAQIWVVASAAAFEGSRIVAVIAILAKTFLGISAAIAMWGLGEVLRRLEGLQRAAHERRFTGASSAATGGDGDANQHAIGQMADVLREIRDLTLLNEEDRAKRREIQGDALVHQLERDVPLLLREHNWVEAHRRLRAARERFPSFKQWTALAEQIEQARRKIEKHDVETTARQVEDLVTLGAWDRALDAVRDLLKRHPDSAEAEALGKKVAVQRDKALAEECARLLAQAQTATDNRDWQAALHLAETLVSRFPNSPEAEAVREQLPTLHENAEIQTRQQMEARIRDLIHEHRFAEALHIAKDVIATYPDSPQAHVLRDQLPRLEQRANEQQGQHV